MTASDSSTIMVNADLNGGKDQKVDIQNAVGGHDDGNNANFRVSFREDVVFKMSNSSTTRSATSYGTDRESMSTSSSQQHKFTKLRSSLTRDQKNRDPFFFYQVTKNLGSGSMGDVKLVKKRADKVGGSARRDIQEAVKRQQREKECLNMPFIGGLFQFCIDADLKDTPSTSRHSTTSFLSVGNGGLDDSTTSGSRSYEDSLLFNDSSSSVSSESEIIYAMKSIHLDQVTEKVFIDELRNEIAILKDLDHPNIVRAIETFEWRGKISIVMELCSGGDLYHRDPYTEQEAARIVSSILSAIAYMHSRNVIHRDLKFENVLFVNASPMSEVKLIDFGLSRVYGENELTDVCGTIYTMAPEVIKGNHTEKADLWSIGVIAFMLLASALPFYGRDRASVVQRIMANKYSFRGKRWKAVSSQAKNFVRALLVSDPDKRADAESALKLAWLAHFDRQSNHKNKLADLREEQEQLARASMLRYAGYPKLKKMALMVVAHKSSSEEIGILKKLFKKYDSRHDGSIWFEEFCKTMSGHGYVEEELRNIFDAMDLSGSGGIKYTEFIAATIEAHGVITEARLAEAFDRLDSDDSGFITAKNLVEILGEDVPKDEIDAIIEEADLSNDGCVSYSDFLALFEGTQECDKENLRVLGSELSSISVESDISASDANDAHAQFLQEKHLQNTLHTWSAEMQVPAHEFAQGCSFLHQVALGHQTEIEKILEEKPGFVNFRDYDRRTPLHIAASEGNVDICKYLIKKGARINRSDRWGGFPLDDAHRHQRMDVVNLLREHGAKFGSTSQTVNLIKAASEGNVEEVKTLLEFGSMDLNQGDYDQRTALHLAANDGNLEVVKLLCQAGADINVKDRWGDTPLDDARKAKQNSSAIVNILSGVTSPYASEQQPAATTDLKDQSINHKIVLKADERKDEGMTQLPVQEFAMACSLLHQAALGNQIVLEKIFLERPSMIHFRDYDRRTPLHLAASEGQLHICQFLVAMGARINRIDRWGGSPLDDAHREGHADVVKFLRGRGAKFGSISQETNFITAAAEGDKVEVQAVLDFGNININSGDYDKRTALHLAAGEGHLDIVEMLCKAGANVNVEDRWGHRPLDDAKNAKQNSSAIMKLLMKHGAESKHMTTAIRTALLNVMVTE